MILLLWDRDAGLIVRKGGIEGVRQNTGDAEQCTAVLLTFLHLNRLIKIPLEISFAFITYISTCRVHDSVDAVLMPLGGRIRGLSNREEFRQYTLALAQECKKMCLDMSPW